MRRLLTEKERLGIDPQRRQGTLYRTPLQIFGTVTDDYVRFVAIILSSAFSCYYMVEFDIRHADLIIISVESAIIEYCQIAITRTQLPTSIRLDIVD